MKERKNLHGRSSLSFFIIIHFQSIYSFEYEMDIQMIREKVIYLQHIFMHTNFAMSVGIDASQRCPIDETTRLKTSWGHYLSLLFLMITLNERERETNNNDDDSLLLLTHFKLSLKVNRLLSILYLEVIRLTTKHMCDIVVLRASLHEREQKKSIYHKE